ncbi:MAG TPA: PKD domain-containing protein, partial [Candidatus Eisenbacteria bacterium]|nr:PKD domain-containing protein [Candidatus Eisenbacteria bacterium]
MRRLLESSLALLLVLGAALAGGGCSIFSPGTDPEAAFDAATRSGPAPLRVQFGDQSKPGSSPIKKWTWWFGDGAESTDRNPVHVYEEAGTYSVTLLVSTDDGADTEIKTDFITVTATPVAADAEFSGAPRDGGKPLTVQFTDLSNPGNGTITSWAWSFGDGGTSTSKNPSHVYQNDGAYDVSLTVRTSAGSNTETKSGYIVVSAGPTAAFTGDPLSGTKPLTVQ